MTVVTKKRFRLRDPETGLFWAVASSAQRPKFNEIGKHWGSQTSALRNWADYNYHRQMENAVKDDRDKSGLIPARDLLDGNVRSVVMAPIGPLGQAIGPNGQVYTPGIKKFKRMTKEERILSDLEDDGPYPQVLELVEYEVVETLRGPKRAKPSDMSSAVRFERNTPNQYNAASFLKDLLHKGKYPKFILFCAGEKMEVPRGVSKFNFLKVDASIGSFGGRVVDHLYLAVYSETDMIYFRMGMSEHLKTIWSMETGESVYER